MSYIIVFILGSIWGSFSNVCIHRIPGNKSVVKGRSYCPACNKQIRWYDNIPLLSYIFLKAKCRDCSAGISIKYFIVELICALSFVLVFYLFDFSLTTLLFFILSIFFVIIFFIDLKHFIIPNQLTFPLMAIGFFKTFNPNLNQEGMGLGDAKLLSAIGFWFGWISIPFILFFSSFIALAYALPSLLNKSKNMSSSIPYGPYLVLGCVLYLLLLKQIVLYLN